VAHGKPGGNGRRALALTAAAALAAGAAWAAERGADGTFDQRTSAHFSLYQDVDIDETGGFHGSRRFEQEVLDELERAFDRLDRLLDLRPGRRIDVVVYDPAVFDRQFNGRFRFRTAGFYHGVIRVRGDTRLTVELSRVLHHELVHAALDAAAPSLIFPGWVNEGGAEWFEARALGKRGLSSAERAAQRARIAYLQSYALIDYLVRGYGERKLSNFYAELMRSRNLERALDRVYRLDSRSLEARYLAELD
jgi:hypothetical protein